MIAERERAEQDGASSSVLGWLARTRRSMALYAKDDYRRDFYRLTWLSLRGLVGVRLGFALLLLAASGVVIFATNVDTPRLGYDILAVLFGMATMLGAAPMYAADQRQGTLELLWLATGSRGRLLLHKVLVLMVGLGVLMVPSVLLVSWFLEGNLPVLLTIAFLLVNSLLIIAVMAWTGTLLPQAWAGGLMGMVFLVAFYLAFGKMPSVFNVFLSPVPGQVEAVMAGGGAFATKVGYGQLCFINRVIIVPGFVILLLYSASIRLKNVFRFSS